MSSELARVIITKFLGEYLENIDSDNIAVGLWSGNLSLDDVKVKTSAFDKFQLPIKIIHGKINKINLSIPYKSILMGISASVEIYLDTLTIYTKTNPQENWEFFDYTNYDYKKNLIKSFTEDLLLKIKISENPKLNNTYVNRMVNNIIDNIQIKINNLLVIHEDKITHNAFDSYIGLQCKEISITSINKQKTRMDTTGDHLEFSKIEKDFKILEFSFFLVPIEKYSGKVFSLNFLNSNQQAQIKNLLEWGQRSNPDSIHSTAISNSMDLNLKDYFIIHPINLSLNLKRNEINSKYKIDAQIDSIEFDLERKQFACALKMIDYVNKYTQFYKDCYFYRRFKIFKPELELIHPEGKNLSEKEITQMIEMNKILKKNYCFKYLRHFFKGIYNLVKDRHYKNSKQPRYLIDLKTLQTMKKFFIQNYSQFYINEISLPFNTIKEMRKIIRFVDKEIINEWIKEVIADIYTEEKKVEQKSGFFGGIKSYFYKSAIDTIKYDEKVLTNMSSDQYIHIQFKFNYCSLSLSEFRLQNNNSKKESSKFMIKSLSGEIQKLNKEFEDKLLIKFSVDEFKFTFLTRMNNSVFTRDIIIPIQDKFSSESEKTSNKILNFEMTKFPKNGKIFVKLKSQAFIFNQNFVENITRFFNITEFDQYSSMIKKTDLLAFDMNFLTKYNFENLSSEANEEISFTIIIDNQQLLLPFKNINEEDKNTRPLIVFNMGNFEISKKELAGIYFLNASRINIGYFYNFSEYLKKEILGENLENSLNTFLKKEKILEEFSMNLVMDINSSLNFDFKLSEINLNLNFFILKKLLKLPEIFEIHYDSDIWESVFENKNQIFTNSIKKGAVSCMSTINREKEIFKKYFCLLAGGYLYLFEKPENIKQDILIPLKNATVSQIFQNSETFYFNISSLPSDDKSTEEFSYDIGLSNEESLLEWKNLIESRIAELKSYSNKINFASKKSDDHLGININSNTVEESNKNIFKDKLKENIIQSYIDVMNLFKNRLNIQHKINLDFSLNSLVVNFTDDYYQREENLKSTLKYILEFQSFGLNVKLNELFLYSNVELSQINLKSVCFDQDGNASECEAYSILSNKLNLNEKLMSISIIAYHSEIFSLLSNAENILSSEVITSILNSSQDMNGQIMYLKGLAKTEVAFSLSNMTFQFNPRVIKSFYNVIMRINTTLNSESSNVQTTEGDMLILKKTQAAVTGTKLGDINSKLNKDNPPVEDNTGDDLTLSHNEHPILSLSALFKSLDLIIFNKNTKLKIFSFELGESQFNLMNYEDSLKINLSLGNFQLNEHLDFPNSFNNDTNFIEKKRELLGLADKNKNSSLRLNLIIYNDPKPKKDSIALITTLIELELESVKLNFVYKLIMRVIDCVIYDIIDSFSIEDMEIEKSKVKEKKNEVSIESKESNLENVAHVTNPQITNEKINQNFLETFDLNIIIHNPTIVLFDVLDNSLYYKLDFGKIYVKKNMKLLNYEHAPSTTTNTTNKIIHDSDSNLNPIYFYNVYEIEFNNTSIKSHDNFEVCQPLNISLNISLLKNTLDNLDIQTEYPFSEFDLTIFVKMFDFEIRKVDYENFLILYKNNIQLDDGCDRILFDYEDVAKPKEIQENKEKLIQKKLKFSLNFLNEIFKLKLIDENSNYMQLYLLECQFNLEEFTTNQKIKINSKNIFIQDNLINIISNKKGIDKIANMKNYSQFHFTLHDDYISSLTEIHLSLIDIKFLLKLDLLNLIQNFLKISNDDGKKSLSYQNQNENEIKRENTNKVNEDRKKEKNIIVNVSILNNVIFLKSQNHYKEQEILACEGDLIFSYKKIIRSNQEKIILQNYSMKENGDINFALENFYFYRAKIISFESDFESIYNKRILIEPMNMFSNVKMKTFTHSHPELNLNPDANAKPPGDFDFDKTEIFVDLDKIKIKSSYNDFFFILNTTMLNIKNISDIGEIADGEKFLSKEEEVKVFEPKKPEDATFQNLEKFQNSLELFLNLKSVDVLIINDLNNILCPILQLFLTNLESTLFIDLNKEILLKSDLDIFIKYFNYKISIWEPAIENFRFNFIMREKNIITNIKSSLNINITEELIFLLKNSFESFKLKFVDSKNSNNFNRQISSTINISNHVFHNFSGDDIILKFPIESLSEVKVKNGSSCDLDYVLNENLQNFSTSERNFEQGEDNFLNEIYFVKEKFSVSIKNLSLNLKNKRDSCKKNSNSASEIVMSKLREKNLFYNVSLDKIRRNYFIHSKFILNNSTDFEFFVNIERDELVLLKPQNRIGLRQFDQFRNRILISIENDEKTSSKIFSEIEKFELSFNKVLAKLNKNNDTANFLNFSLSGLCFVLKIEKEKINFQNSDFELIVLSIFPQFIIENFLSFDLKVKKKYSKLISQEERLEYVIKNGHTENMYFNYNSCINEDEKISSINQTDQAVLTFYIASESSSSKYNSNESQIYQTDLYMNEIIDKEELDVGAKNIKDINFKEHSKILRFTRDKSSDHYANSISLKLNYVIDKGVVKLFVFSDYLIINTTEYNIFPSILQQTNAQIEGRINSIASQDEYKDEKVKFKHTACRATDNEENKSPQSNVEYFLVENFENCQLKLLSSEGDILYQSSKLHITPENYAYIKEVILSNSLGPERYFQFIIERHIKYIKFTELKKVDMIVIKPKYVIVNNLDYDILVHTTDKNYDGDLQGSAGLAGLIVKAHTERIIHARDGLVSFKVIYGETATSNATELLKMNNPLSEQIVLNKSDSRLCYITLFNEISGPTSKLTINTTTNSNSLIFLENRTDLVVKIFQKTRDDSDFVNVYTLLPGEKKPFNWTKIFISRYLKIEIVEQGTDKILDYYMMTDYDSIEKGSGQYVYHFRNRKDILFRILFEGTVQKFLFDKKTELTVENLLRFNSNNKENIVPDKLNNLDNLDNLPEYPITLIKIISQIIINVKKISLSVINYQSKMNNMRTELVNLHLCHLSFVYLEEIKNNSERITSIEFKLEDLQMDNVSNNLNSIYKVNLFKIKKVPLKESDENINPLIHALVEIKKPSNSDEVAKLPLDIEKIDFLIQSFGICLDSEILYEIFKFIKSLEIDVENSLIYSNLTEILDVLITSNIKNSYENDPKNKIFINYLRTSPINFLLSYKNISNELFNELNIRSTIAQNIIEVFTNNDKVNIQLKAIEMKRVFGNSSEITAKIIQYYYFNLLYQALRLFFSIDILGNPINLLTNLGYGVKDFFYLPMQGFIRGPFEFIYGSISGTKSLVSHTVGGALDSTQKITSSIGKNLLKLSNSEDYINERQKIFLDPKSKNQKFSTSLKIILLGIKYGARDFLFLPYFYMKNEGALFLPKGILLGITSIIVKPITGVLDFLSFFSGNLSLQILNSYETTFNSLKIKSKRRIFWGSNKYIKSTDKESKIVSEALSGFDIDQMQKEFLLKKDRDLYSNFGWNNAVIKKCFFFKIETLDKIIKLAIGMFVNDVLTVYDLYGKKFDAIIVIEDIIDVTGGDDARVKILYKDWKNLNLPAVIELAFDLECVKASFCNYLSLSWKK